jgi:4-hydroxybenzoyl-CoA thioesterase
MLTKEIKIRFEHCDPAGIVFYPHYFEFFNQMVEDFFDEQVGVSFQTMHQDWKLGVPLVHIESDFLKASRIGDVLQFNLRLAKIGTKSIHFAIDATKDDEVRVKSSLTLACVNLGDRLKGQEIPRDFRKRMEPFLEA